MAEMLATEAASYALVVATPVRRARETAQLVGGRIDLILPELLPDLGPVLSYADYLALLQLSDWIAFVRQDARARRLAEEQLHVWAGLVARVADGQRVLAASHGGTIEIPAAQLAVRLGAALDGPTFGYCEGVRVTFDRGAPTALQVLRL